MSKSNNLASAIDQKLSTTRKTILLNPNAAEFVPSSSFYNNSDNEAHQYWRHQLPDDITPDFNVAGDEDSRDINTLPFSKLSLADVNETSYGENQVYSSFQQLAAKPWDMHGYVDDVVNEQKMESTELNRVKFLATQFAGFAAESVADVYFANGGDLNLTIEMLTRLELQVDGGFNQHPLNSKVFSAPNSNNRDFPALSHPHGQNGDDHQQHINPNPSTNLKIASQESRIWKYNRNPSQNTTIGSSRSSHVLASAYNGDRLANRKSTRLASVWLETGDDVANMYSEMCGEARDHARLRNVYFEQGRQAYLVGYKALAKELSVKGQLHNMQMKAAHGKAQESIYRQRNPMSPRMQGNGRGVHERLIDLHGLQVTEAIHILKRDLTMLKNVARSADEHVQVYICVGTGHHTSGAHIPARLSDAVQRYLFEEEGLDYSERQPGLLRVVLY